MKKQKSDVDIMDAPLSREGILEALSLCNNLRQYVTKNQLKSYNELFENTRKEINDIIPLLVTTTDDETKKQITTKLQTLLKQLDEYKIQSLIAQHPPQDDDNLRLPQPTPEIPRHAQVNPNTVDPKAFALSPIADEGAQTSISVKSTEETKDDDNIGENQNIDSVSRSPSGHTTNIDLKDLNDTTTSPYTNGYNKRKGSAATNDSDIGIMDYNITSNHASPSLQSTTSQTQDLLTMNGEGKTKGNKRYMAQIKDPQIPMNAEYVINVLNGNEQKCGIVVSNLRRAMSTACICLRDRLERRPYEKIQILGCLQEIGMNADTRTMLFTKDNKPSLAKTEKTSPLLKDVDMKQLYAERLSTKYYKGDASDKTGPQRLQEFALWLFAQRKYLHVVTVGHSHWFKSFFEAYLPEKIAEEDLPAKVRVNKIRNCGVVAFRIQKRYVASKSKRHGRHISFEIAPNSITTLQFGLYSKPITNHQIKLLNDEKEKDEKEQKEHSQSSTNKDNEYSSQSEQADDDADIADDEKQENSTTLDTPSIIPALEQSSSTMATSATPGILASIQDGQQMNLNNNNNYDFDDFLDINFKDDNKQTGNDTNRPRIPDKSPPPIPPSSTSSNSTHSNSISSNDKSNTFTSLFDSMNDNSKKCMYI